MALMVRYQTPLSVDESKALSAEVDDFWKIAVKDVERDGFSEVRQQLGALASKYPGRVLLVHGQRHTGVGAGGQNIVWTGNLGVLASDAGWSKISVDPARPMLFTAIDHKETVQMSRR